MTNTNKTSKYASNRLSVAPMLDWIDYIGV